MTQTVEWCARAGASPYPRRLRLSLRHRVRAGLAPALVRVVVALRLGYGLGLPPPWFVSPSIAMAYILAINASQHNIRAADNSHGVTHFMPTQKLRQNL